MAANIHSFGGLENFHISSDYSCDEPVKMRAAQELFFLKDLHRISNGFHYAIANNTGLLPMSTKVTLAGIEVLPVLTHFLVRSTPAN